MKEKDSSTTLQYSLVVVLTTAVLIVGLFPGLQATDDLGYAKLAYQIIESGPYIDGNSHKIGRIGAYLPLAAVFGVFGVNELSLAVIPIISSVITSVLIFFIGKVIFGSTIGLMAGLLFSVFPMTLTYGNFFTPEPILGATLCGAVFLCLTSKGSGPGFYDTRKMAAGVLIGIGYLTSEVGSLMLPILLLTQAINGKISRDDLSLIFGFFFILCSELLFYHIVYDNPLHRFAGLGGNYINDPMLVGANKDLFDRLFKAYPRYFLYPQFGFGYFGPLLILGALKGLFNFRKNLLLLTWAATILGFYNFMTVSFDQYIVLPSAARLIYPALIPLLLLSAKFLVDIWVWISQRRITLRVVLQIGFAGSLTLLIIASVLFVYARKNISFTSVLARNSQAAASYLKKEQKITLLSDHRSLRAISFYRGFRRSDNLIPFHEYDQFQEIDRNIGQKKFVVINGPIYDLPKSQKGFFTFKEKRKILMDRLMNSSREVAFNSTFSKGLVFEKLFSSGLLSKLLQDSDYQLAKKFILGKDASGWVVVLPEIAQQDNHLWKKRNFNKYSPNSFSDTIRQKPRLKLLSGEI